MKFVKLDQTGIYVVGHGEATVLPSGAISIPAEMDGAGFLGFYMVDDELRQRPASPVPVKQAEGWQIDAPDGAEVEVYDLIGGEVMAHEMLAPGAAYAFSLADSGSYNVTVSAPLPAMPSNTVIEV
ncbi:hypothetical protein [Thalassovita sp.]|uniref:hypothetical protein n=1 Tax=Thalassovita sp. TaxID=1979401 RepID=UPI002AB13D79|nr:hypothetical protein [Thalassovita sp.]